MTTRRRPAVIAGVLAVVVVAAVAAVLVSSSSGSGPATGAARLVPADALLYLNVSTDPARAAVNRALSVAKRLPGYPNLSAAVLGRVASIAGNSPSTVFATQIRPWLGGEASFALLNTASSAAGSLIVLALVHEAQAQAFVHHQGAIGDGQYRGVALLRYSSGTELAFLNGFLLLGQPASVRAAIDVARGGAPSLSGDAAYRRASAGEPDDRVLDGYVSAAGLRRVLEPRAGAIGGLAQLLDRQALDGVALSLSPASAGATARIHTVLDPTLARVAGGSPHLFTPSLLGEAPLGATLVLDTYDLARQAPNLLKAGARAGLFTQLGPLLGRLGTALRAEGINVSRILSVFSGETLVSVVPVAGRSALVILARTSEPAATRTTLASLEVPLAQLFAPSSSGPGQAPEFNDRAIDGVTAHQLALAPGLQLDYAVLGNLVVVSTSLEAIGVVAQHRGSVTSDPGFRAVLPAIPKHITSLLFFDFTQLLHLVEQEGLTGGASFRTIANGLEQIRAVGLTSTGGEADTTAELFLQIP